MVVQGLIGVRGIDLVDGQLLVDPQRLHPLAKVQADLDHPAFESLTTFASMARGHQGPISWHLAGPLTLGFALLRHGVPARTAFDVGIRATCVTSRAIYRLLAEACPDAPQFAVLDEPGVGGVQCPGFPVAPDAAIDLVSGALAGLELSATVGLHSCGPADWTHLVAAGPQVISIPATRSILPAAAYLARWLENGGAIAWGVVPTDCPVGGADRYARDLRSLWRELAERGCSAELLERHAIFTPACGLAGHTIEQAEHIMELCHQVRDRIQADSLSHRRVMSPG